MATNEQKAVMRASVGQDQWRNISVAKHKTSRTHGPANFCLKPDVLMRVLEAKRVAINCQPNDFVCLVLNDASTPCGSLASDGTY